MMLFLFKMLLFSFCLLLFSKWIQNDIVFFRFKVFLPCDTDAWWFFRTNLSQKNRLFMCYKTQHTCFLSEFKNPLCLPRVILCSDFKNHLNFHSWVINVIFAYFCVWMIKYLIYWSWWNELLKSILAQVQGLHEKITGYDAR